MGGFDFLFNLTSFLLDADGFEGARASKSNRCAFPITAFLVVSPSRPAIWLAVWPFDHNSFNFSTFSSV